MQEFIRENKEFESSMGDFMAEMACILREMNQQWNVGIFYQVFAEVTQLTAGFQAIHSRTFKANFLQREEACIFEGEQPIHLRQQDEVARHHAEYIALDLAICHDMSFEEYCDMKIRNAWKRRRCREQEPSFERRGAQDGGT